MNRYTDEQIAAECHEAIRGLSRIHLDPTTNTIWDFFPVDLRTVVVASVRMARQGASARELHEEWARALRELGWTYGPVRDYVHRQHPNLVGFDELPAIERHKDELFRLITAFMAGLEWT